MVFEKHSTINGVKARAKFCPKKRGGWEHSEGYITQFGYQSRTSGETKEGNAPTGG